MGIMSRLADSYRRWRHSRGFGIHSPFAYTLVTEALYPRRGYSYYMETDPRLDSAHPAVSRRARAIYRLCIRLRGMSDSTAPHSRQTCIPSAPIRHERMPVYLNPEAPECYHTALKLAGVKPVRNPEEAQCCIWTMPADDNSPHPPSHPSEGELLFTGRHISILIRRRCMAPTAYTIP